MAQRTKHSYYIVCVDYGHAREAIVNPEETRRAIVDRLKKGDYSGDIAFIHHVDDLLIEDVTAELFNEAEMELRAEHRTSRADRLANTMDHNRKLRAEAV